ncbi:MAG: ATP-binding protein [Rhodospirillales bacterium]
MNKASPKRLDALPIESRLMLLEKAISFAGVGQFIWSDEQSRFLMATGEVFRIFGIPDDDPREAARLDAYLQWVLPEDRAAIEETYSKWVADGAGYDVEYRIRRADGAVRHIHERGQFITDVKTMPLVLGTMQDITERVERRKRQFLSDRQESVGHLASGVAHELNNLLMPIAGNAQLVERSLAAGDKNRERMGRIVAASKRAAELVESVLLYSQQSIYAIDDEPANIAAIAGDVVDRLAVQLPLGVTIKLSHAEDLRPVRCDAALVAKAIGNILDNARDAVGAGPGDIAVEIREVSIAPDDPTAQGVMPDRYVRIRTADTGPGFSEAALTHAVDPFFTTKEVGSGTGLGLSVAQGIAAQHGGALVVANARNGGAIVDVYLRVPD